MKLNKDIAEIVGLLNKMIAVLSDAGESNWIKALLLNKKSLEEINSLEDFQLVIADMLRMYGGMGSFSDLVLYKDDHVLLSENIYLDNFRSRLFELLIARR